MVSFKNVSLVPLTESDGHALCDVNLNLRSGVLLYLIVFVVILGNTNIVIKVKTPHLKLSAPPFPHKNPYLALSGLATHSALGGIYILVRLRYLEQILISMVLLLIVPAVLLYVIIPNIDYIMIYVVNVLEMNL